MKRADLSNKTREELIVMNVNYGDLQQHHVHTGVLFLLLPILSVML